MRMSSPLRLAVGLAISLMALMLIVGPAVYADSPLSPAAQATAAATVAPTIAPTAAATAAATMAPTAAATAAATVVPTVAATAAPTAAPTPAALPTTGETPGDANLLLAALGVILLIAGIYIAVARSSGRSA